ncbi:Transcription factor bHLH140 [Diplonema papillatum]|nr:Transcription factor bHLH140 [Diplonema papillatum]
MWEYMTKEASPRWRVLDAEMTRVVEDRRKRGDLLTRYEGVVIDLHHMRLSWPDTGGEAQIRRTVQAASPPKAGAPSLANGNEPVQCATLVFPSFSTSIFMFDIQRAAPLACAEIAAFLSSVPALVPTHYVGGPPHFRVRLVLLDRSEDGSPSTPTLDAFKHYTSHLNDPRFAVQCGDVCIASQRGPCFMLANAANAKLYGGPKTGGVNKAIHEAAGPTLAQETSRLYACKTPVSPGVAYPVALLPGTPLYGDGVRHVCHVLGPNMNPKRPNCLTDYTEASRLLVNCYRNLFQCFLSAARAHNFAADPLL